ncbi:hypothetical protein KEM54_001772 [Ascosphaera aggregata]|nr:hypothetical protein KEM54_001772 [Ascosphaera aggregata]
MADENVITLARDLTKFGMAGWGIRDDPSDDSTDLIVSIVGRGIGNVMFGNVRDSRLQSIGSVRENYSSTSDQDDLKELYHSTRDASTIEYLYGESACNDYIDDIRKQSQLASRKAAESASTSAAADDAQISPRSKVRRFLLKVKKVYVAYYKDATPLQS